jgi:hypothetical protein
VLWLFLFLALSAWRRNQPYRALPVLALVIAFGSAGLLNFPAAWALLTGSIGFSIWSVAAVVFCVLSIYFLNIYIREFIAMRRGGAPW